MAFPACFMMESLLESGEATVADNGDIFGSCDKGFLVLLIKDGFLDLIILKTPDEIVLTYIVDLKALQRTVQLILVPFN